MNWHAYFKNDENKFGEIDIFTKYRFIKYKCL